VAYASLLAVRAALLWFKFFRSNPVILSFYLVLFIASGDMLLYYLTFHRGFWEYVLGLNTPTSVVDCLLIGLNVHILVFLSACFSETVHQNSFC
jgi:hypothetical protein